MHEFKVSPADISKQVKINQTVHEPCVICIQIVKKGVKRDFNRSGIT